MLLPQLGQERVSLGFALAAPTPRFYMHIDYYVELACSGREETVQLQARTEERIVIFVTSRAFPIFVAVISYVKLLFAALQQRGTNDFTDCCAHQTRSALPSFPHWPSLSASVSRPDLYLGRRRYYRRNLHNHGSGEAQADATGRAECQNR